MPPQRRLPLMQTFLLTLHLLLPHSADAHHHPFPESVAQDLNWRVNASLAKKQTLGCLTGNPIDDCWRCDPNWANDRQRLADCGLGFGRGTLGGKGGPFYVVDDPSDSDPTSTPKPGTLRDAVTRPGPVWVVFAADMEITLRRPLVVTSQTTIDGRGTRVGVTGAGCIVLEHVTHVIIHNIGVYGCKAEGSDGDGIHVVGSAHVWVDHCELSGCADGLIDCTEGSTAITVSNSHMFGHDKVMLLGHSDEFEADKKMQVTVAFNRFGEGVVQRMPRCRFGYFHIVNNDYTDWGIYAIGGSASPTINSQGNRYMAPANPDAKEVTRRLGANDREWERWDWRTVGDILVNGAFFVPSGDGVSSRYSMASSLAPKSAAFIDHLTLNAGLLLPNGGAILGGSDPAFSPPESGGAVPYGGGISGGGTAIGGFAGGGFGVPGGGGTQGYDGMIFSKAPLQPSCRPTLATLSSVIIVTFWSI